MPVPADDTSSLIDAARHAAHEYLKRFKDVFTTNEREDLAQDVALALLRDPRMLHDRSRLDSWSRTVARRLRCRRLMRYWHLQNRRLDGVAEPAVATPGRRTEFCVAGGLRLPLRPLLAQLELAIGELPELNAHIVRARYEGFCCAEIAVRYGLAVPSVKRRLHRARLRLRSRLLAWVAAQIRDSAPGTGLGAIAVDGGHGE